MNRLKYIWYWLVFLIGSNSIIFFSYFGYLIVYDYSRPFVSKLFDQVCFIIFSIISAYFSAFTSLWAYKGIKNQKRNLHLDQIGESFEQINHVFLLFSIIILPGIFYYGIYNSSTIYYGILILLSFLLYISVIIIGYLIIVTSYNAELIEKEYLDIIKKDRFSVLGLIFFYFTILQFFFILSIVFGGILYTLYPKFDYSLFFYGSFVLLYYPVFLIGTYVIIFLKRKRLVVDFLFTELLIEHGKKNKIPP